MFGGHGPFGPPLATPMDIYALVCDEYIGEKAAEIAKLRIFSKPRTFGCEKLKWWVDFQNPHSLRCFRRIPSTGFGEEELHDITWFV